MLKKIPFDFLDNEKYEKLKRFSILFPIPNPLSQSLLRSAFVHLFIVITHAVTLCLWQAMYIFLSLTSFLSVTTSENMIAHVITSSIQTLKKKIKRSWWIRMGLIGCQNDFFFFFFYIKLGEGDQKLDLLVGGGPGANWPKGHYPKWCYVDSSYFLYFVQFVETWKFWGFCDFLWNFQHFMQRNSIKPQHIWYENWKFLCFANSTLPTAPTPQKAHSTSPCTTLIVLRLYNTTTTIFSPHERNITRYTTAIKGPI